MFSISWSFVKRGFFSRQSFVSFVGGTWQFFIETFDPSVAEQLGNISSGFGCLRSSQMCQVLIHIQLLTHLSYSSTVCHHRLHPTRVWQQQWVYFGCAMHNSQDMTKPLLCNRGDGSRYWNWPRAPLEANGWLSLTSCPPFNPLEWPRVAIYWCVKSSLFDMS